MATSPEAYGLIADIVDEARDRQPLVREKANTVTTAIGTGVTALLAGLAYWAESGGALPSWVPVVVTVAGFLATTAGVSQTKNGITASTAQALCDVLNARIDAHHDHGDETGEAESGVDDLRAAADQLAKG